MRFFFGTTEDIARQSRNQSLNAKSRRTQRLAKLCETLNALRLCVERKTCTKNKKLTDSSTEDTESPLGRVVGAGAVEPQRSEGGILIAEGE